MCVQFMKERFALDISMYNNSFLEKTIKGRLVATSCESAVDYLIYLDNAPDEPTLLIEKGIRNKEVPGNETYRWRLKWRM